MKKSLPLISISFLLLSLTACAKGPLSQFNLSFSAVSSSEAISSDSNSKEESGQSQDPYYAGEGVIPKKVGNSIQYGIYPQNVITDPDEIRYLNRVSDSFPVLENGWHMIDDHPFLKIHPTPASEEYCFNPAYGPINPEKEYWFHVSPVSWSIMSSDSSGNYLVAADFVLDRAPCFNSPYEGKQNGHYANAWEDSEIRRFLHNEFFETAFRFSKKEYIVESVVDNSPLSMDYREEEEENGKDTTDRFFLPSYMDLLGNRNPSLGNYLISCVSDYSRAIGVLCEDNVDDFGASLWTRTPCEGSQEVWSIKSGKEIEMVKSPIESTNLGIRPMMVIHLPE